MEQEQSEQPQLPPPSPSPAEDRAFRCHQWVRAEVACRCCKNAERVKMFGRTDPNGNTIDLEASFCLSRCWSILLVKLTIWCLTVASFIYGWSSSAYPHWFMANLSYWTFLYACVYLTLSLITSALAVLKDRPQQNEATFLIKATWVMYLVAVVHGIIVVVLFWVTEYDPDTWTVQYITVFAHGISFLLVFVDGVLINKIPVRLSHYIFCLGFGLLFVVWSLVQALLPVDNPTKPSDDEALYEILDWKNSPGVATIVCVLVLFVAMPICIFVFWSCSLWRRRYVTKVNDNDDGNNSRVAQILDSSQLSSGNKSVGKQDQKEEDEEIEDLESPTG